MTNLTETFWLYKQLKNKILHYIMGFIYKITCNITGECYYGKSNSTEKLRLSAHRSKSNHSQSKQIIERGNYTFLIVEDNIEKDNLTEREHFYITNNECINITIPWTKDTDKNERNKIQMNKMYKDNEEFKKKQIKNSNQYYHTNKEIINKKRNEYILCECGLNLNKRNILRHHKTIKHQNYLSNQTIC